jgi:hypothetical protein
MFGIASVLKNRVSAFRLWNGKRRGPQSGGSGDEQLSRNPVFPERRETRFLNELPSSTSSR